MLSPINKNINLNYGQLDDILKNLGYTASKATGGHIVYKHSKKNSLLAVKHSRKTDPVPKAVVASIVRNVVNTKVADESQIKEANNNL